MTARSPRLDLVGGRETRSFSTRLQARDDGRLEFRLDGYASVTNTLYDMGPYEEQITRGAFTKTLSENPDVQLLTGHEGLPLARTTNGSLHLSEDDNGLHVTAQLDRDDPDAQVVMRKIGTCLLDQCSFAFRVIRQTWNSDRTQRSIHEVSLDRGDVSVVNYGASPTTSVTARAADRGLLLDAEVFRARAYAIGLRGLAR